MDTKIIEQWHPKLIGKDYKIIKTKYDLGDFNCIAFTLDIYDEWIWCNTKSWPYDIIGNRIPSIENFIKFFNLYKYDICDNNEYEEDFNKIAIYTNKKYRVSHAAKQYGNMWRSKLGVNQILEHKLEWISGFDCENYGTIHSIMKKKI